MKTLQFEALGQNTKSSGNHLRLQESIRKSTRESTREYTEESTRDSLVEPLWKWLTAKRLYSKTENMHWSTHKQEIDLTYLVDKTFRMLVQEARWAKNLKNFLELCKREITKFWASTKNYRLLIKKFEEALACWVITEIHRIQNFFSGHQTTAECGHSTLQYSHSTHLSSSTVPVDHPSRTVSPQTFLTNFECPSPEVHRMVM